MGNAVKFTKAGKIGVSIATSVPKTLNRPGRDNKKEMVSLTVSVKDTGIGISPLPVDKILVAAHTLKSSSGSVGAMKLSGIFKELESACKTGTMNDPESYIQRIHAEFERVKTALEKEIPRQ